MEWTNVKDEMPKESGVYIVNIHQESENDSVDFVTEAWYRKEKPLLLSDEVGWHLLNEFYEFSNDLRHYITHWMAYPEPPIQ